MNYAASGGNAETIQAIKDVLDAGGNAVDAAIAGYLVSFVSEPTMASIGAGGFAIVNHQNQCHVVDFFCQTPLKKKPIENLEFFPITVDFGPATEDFHIGKGSIAVPGAIAGIFAMHRQWGRMPIKELILPAKTLAARGVEVDAYQELCISLLKELWHASKGAKDLFYESDRLKRKGDLIVMPGFADFLDVLGHEGESLVYRGEIAQIICDDLKENGYLIRADFENYKVKINKGLHVDVDGHRVVTCNYPSVGGMMVAATIKSISEALKNFRGIRYNGGIGTILIDVFSRIKSLGNNPQKISEFLFSNYGVRADIEQGIGKKWGGTAHFNVIDNQGMTVTLTTSIGEGSGYFVPGIDMQMNNMLGEKALMPHGFHNWTPNVRLQSMMAPTLVIGKTGDTEIALGTGGAGRIPYILSQVMTNILFLDIHARKAVESPRLILGDERVEVEPGFVLDGIHSPINMWDHKSMFFGGVNLIEVMDGYSTAIADSRRMGSEMM